MKKLVILFLGLALLSGGCASTVPKRKTTTPPKETTTQPEQKERETAGFLQRYAESRRLSAAVALLGKGDNAEATKILEAICNGKSVPGVTDEALFRLALLTLKSSAERPVSPQGIQLLKRLRKEYPSSAWTVQAAPLVDLVNSADELKRQSEELKRQNKSYRSTNQALTKEVNELNKAIAERNKNIEQLKHLDLEIEKNTR